MIKAANLTGPVSRVAGGLYLSVRRLVQELSLTGVEVSVLGTIDDFTQQDLGAWEPIKMKVFKAIGPRQFGFTSGYVDFLEYYRPQILQTNGIWMYSSVATHRFSKKFRVPYMISTHGMLDPWAVRNSYWKKWIAGCCYENAHLRDAACLRALCQSEADAMRAYGLSNPIAIIPNAVDLPKEEQELGDRSWEIGQDKQPSSIGSRRSSSRILLFLGRIHLKKGLPNLIRGFNKALHAAPPTADAPWQLVIAGWDQGGHEAELMKLCEELGLSFERLGTRDERRGAEASVVFFGPAFGEEKKSLLRSADAFVLPSFSEGLPMSVLEAWSYKLPVVMTPECNLPEGFAADAAIRIGTGVESIAAGLDSLFSMNESDLQAMGSKGRTLVEERFTWKTIAAQMREVYDWMLGGGATPSSVVEK